jgi:hypothetical protein
MYQLEILDETMASVIARSICLHPRELDDKLAASVEVDLYYAAWCRTNGKSDATIAAVHMHMNGAIEARAAIEAKSLAGLSLGAIVQSFNYSCELQSIPREAANLIAARGYPEQEGVA